MLENKSFQFKGSNQRLISADLTYKNVSQPMPIAVFCHGFKGFKDWGDWHLCAQYFALNDYPFFKFNFSHNGTTPKELTEFLDLEAFRNNTLKFELDDLGLVIDFIYQKADNFGFNWNGEIFLVGHSRGAGIAIARAVNDKRIRKVVTWAGLIDFEKHLSMFPRDEWKQKGVLMVKNIRTGIDMPISYHLFEDYTQHIQELNLEKLLPDLNVPILGIFGENDSSIDSTHAEMLEKLVEHSVVVWIEYGTHTFGMQHPSMGILSHEMREALEETLEFFNF